MEQPMIIQLKNYLIASGAAVIPERLSLDQDKLYIHRRKLEYCLKLNESLSDNFRRKLLKSLTKTDIRPLLEKEFNGVSFPESCGPVSLSTDFDDDFFLPPDEPGRKHHIPAFLMLEAVCLAQLEQLNDMPESPIRERFAELTSLYNLSPNAVALLEMLFILQITGMEANSISRMRDSGRLKRIRHLANLRILSARDIIAETDPTSPLVRLSLIDGARIEIYEFTSAFIEGLLDTPIIQSFFQPLNPHEDTLKLNDFPKPMREHMVMIQGMIVNRNPDQGVAILLYGKPGTGKTACSQTIAEACRSVGYQAYTIPVNCQGGNRFDSSLSNRMRALCSIGVLGTKKTLVICDEADEILCAAGGLNSHRSMGRIGKSAINEFLDTNTGAVIFISNNHWDIDESTRRRFNYSLSFEALADDQIKKVCDTSIKRHGLTDAISPETAFKATRGYAIQPGGIQLAVEAGAMLKGKKFSTAKVMGNVVRQHARLMQIPKNKLGPEKMNTYALDIVNLKGETNIADYLTALKNFHHSLKAGQSPHPSGITCLNTLLSGPPGTGKTEFVKYLASQIGCELIVHSAGTIKDKYVGQTERNIRNAFAAAQSQRAILFFDEIDSLLVNRQQADQQYQVAQTTELLACMETFKCVFLAATNLPDNLDPACRRRFAMKLEFDYLAQTGRKRLFNSFFAGLAASPLADDGLDRLKHIPGLTPGCFHAVRGAFAFRSGGPWPVTELLNALETEASGNLPKRVNKRVMGFAENVNLYDAKQIA